MENIERHISDLDWVEASTLNAKHIAMANGDCLECFEIYPCVTARLYFSWENKTQECRECSSTATLCEECGVSEQECEECGDAARWCSRHAGDN